MLLPLSIVDETTGTDFGQALFDQLLSLDELTGVSDESYGDFHCLVLILRTKNTPIICCILCNVSCIEYSQRASWSGNDGVFQPGYDREVDSWCASVFCSFNREFDLYCHLEKRVVPFLFALFTWSTWIPRKPMNHFLVIDTIYH